MSFFALYACSRPKAAPQGTETFTVSGFPTNANPFSPGDLKKQVGTIDSPTSDINYAYGSGKVINRTTITPPDGEDDTQLINNIGTQYGNVNLKGVNYVLTGNIPGTYTGNSNNFAYTLGSNSGVKNQLDSFNPDPGHSTPGGAQGYKTVLPSTSISRQISAVLGKLQGLLTQLSNHLK